MTVEVVTMDLVLKEMKMKLKRAHENYTVATTKASDILRNINYSIIAVCWIFSNQKVSNIKHYTLIILFIVLSLSFDLFQYIIKGICTGMFFRKKEKDAKYNDDAEIDNYPNWFSYIVWGMWILKFMSFMIGLCLLIKLLLL